MVKEVSSQTQSSHFNDVLNRPKTLPSHASKPHTRTNTPSNRIQKVNIARTKKNQQPFKPKIAASGYEWPGKVLTDAIVSLP